MHLHGTLSKAETVAVIKEQEGRSLKRPASQIAEQPPASKRIQSPKGSVVKTPTTSSKTGVDTPPPNPKETIKAKTAAIKAPVVPKGPDPVIPLPELTGPPAPQQSPIEYKGNAGIREPSQVRGKRPSKGQGLRFPHAATAVLGKGTPSIPPEEAVGAYRTDSTDRSIVPQSQDQGPDTRESSGDRSRSRDPTRDLINLSYQVQVELHHQRQVNLVFTNSLSPLLRLRIVRHK